MTARRAAPAVTSWLSLLAACALLVLAPVRAHEPAAVGRIPQREFTVAVDVFPQNFAITHDAAGRVFLGNMGGVLVFDGAHWSLVPTANGDMVRSLAAGEDGRVWVGGYDTFGYLQRGPAGSYAYHDLRAAFADALGPRRFADIWSLVVARDAVYFRALHDLFRYEPASGRVQHVHHEQRLGEIVRSGDRVLMHFRGEGLREYRDGRWRPVTGSPERLAGVGYVPMAALADGSVVVLGDEGPWLRLTHDALGALRVEPLPESLDVPHHGNATFVLPLDGASFVYGTPFGEAVFVDLDSWRSEAVAVSDGFMSDATRMPGARLLFATDTGFVALDWPAPWRIVDEGLAGRVSDQLTIDGASYVMASGGAFRRAAGSAAYERLDWTGAEAWALLPLANGDRLFADSTAIVQQDADGTTTVVDAATSARLFVPSRFDADLVWVGTELGLQVLQRGPDGRWRSVLRDDGMDGLRITQIVERAPGELWVGSERGGIRQLRLRRTPQWSLTDASVGEDDGLEYGALHAGAYLYEDAGGLIASTSAGLFRLDGERFVRTELDGLAPLLPHGETVELAFVAGERWANTYRRVFRYANGWEEIDVSNLLATDVSSITASDAGVVVGSEGRVLVFDPALVRPAPPLAPLALADARVFADDADADGRALPLEAIEIRSGAPALALRWVLPDLEAPERIAFRTRLLPEQRQFSPWSDDDAQSFVALAPGDYRFEIEARDARGRVATLAVPIVVTPRWFETPAVRWTAALLVLSAAVFATSRVARHRARRLRGERDRFEAMVAERTRELAAANAQLDRMAYLDGLTQIPNRRRLDALLGECWLRGLERERVLAVALVDVDHFKQYNDSFGHQAGDALLVQLAELLTRTLRRDEDTVGRYGGEEFLVVLPGADLPRAREVLEEMRAAVAESDLDVTISAGVHACVPDEAGSPAALVAAADTALYRAKELGRDRVVTSLALA